MEQEEKMELATAFFEYLFTRREMVLQKPAEQIQEILQQSLAMWSLYSAFFLDTLLLVRVLPYHPDFSMGALRTDKKIRKQVPNGRITYEMLVEKDWLFVGYLEFTPAERGEKGVGHFIVGYEVSKQEAEKFLRDEIIREILYKRGSMN